MWIITNKGYISIVAHRSKKDTVLVRARARDDIEYFAGLIDDLFGIDANVRTTISEERPADYEFRMEVKRPAIAMVMASEIDSIDYTNFKSSVRDSFRHSVYMGAYNALLKIGDRTRRESGERQGCWGSFGAQEPMLPFSDRPHRSHLVGGDDGRGASEAAEREKAETLWDDLHSEPHEWERRFVMPSTDREAEEEHEWGLRGFSIEDGENS